MPNVPIANVSDTARWVAFYRAMESERSDAIFRDPFARKLAGPEGEAIVDAIPRGRSMAWPMIVRTAVFDEIILARIAAGADAVINLAAGLDARPWRLDLPPELRWYDVDLPGILGYKLGQVGDAKPRCRYEAIFTDLADAEARRALFARLGGEVRNALVVTEGLLVYLTADIVAEFARDLHAQPAFRWWLTDLASPLLLKYMARSWGKALERGNAPMRFGPAEGTDFFRPLGWRVLEERTSMGESERLNRGMEPRWLFRIMMSITPKKRREALRTMSKMVLFEQA